MEGVESKKVTTKFGNIVKFCIRAGSMTARNQLFNRNINYAKCLTMKGNAFLNMFYGKLIQLCFQNNKK